jgi:CHASE3 domain sensor protein
VKIASASRIVGAGLVFASFAAAAVVLATVILVMSRFALFATTQEARGALTALENGVKAADEAARAYAVTGRGEYRETLHVLQQDAPARRARVLATLQRTGLTDEEYAQLRSGLREAIELEVIARQAERHAQSQDLAAATALMFGAAQVTARQAFELELASTRATFEARIGSQFQRLTFMARVGGFGAVGLLVVMLIAVLLTLRKFVDRHLVEPMVTLADRAEQAETSDQDVARGFERHSSEIGRLARALERLRRARIASERQRELRTRLAEILGHVQQADDCAGFAARLLSALAAELPLVSGALFERPETDARFRVAGTWGVARESLACTEFDVGEGVAGQAVAEGRELRVHDLPPVYLARVGAAGDALRPALALLLPLRSGDAIVGVLELLLLSEPDAEQEQVLRESTALLSPRLEALQHSAHSASLLEQSRAQASHCVALEQELAALRATA